MLPRSNTCYILTEIMVVPLPLKRRTPKIHKRVGKTLILNAMKDLFSCKMMGSDMYDALEEQYNVYEVDTDWGRSHDASPSGQGSKLV